ncbi:MAG: hypothetical protein HYV16_04525 [Gammaproteobacteria bacterium]|nr:hypothetical protein [Gammaproteobacteria bacterium]
MKARLLFKTLLVSTMLLSGTVSASVDADPGIERLTVTPDAIQLQMLLAQRAIRQELAAQFDWQAIALESLRNVLAQPIVAELGADSRDYAGR